MTRIELQIQLHKDLKAFEAALESDVVIPTGYSPGCIWIGSQDTDLEAHWSVFATMMVEQVNKYIPQCDFPIEVQCFEKEMEIVF